MRRNWAILVDVKSRQASKLLHQVACFAHEVHFILSLLSFPPVNQLVNYPSLLSRSASLQFDTNTVVNKLGLLPPFRDLYLLFCCQVTIWSVHSLIYANLKIQWILHLLLPCRRLGRGRGVFTITQVVVLCVIVKTHYLFTFFKLQITCDLACNRKISRKMGLLSMKLCHRYHDGWSKRVAR